MLSLDVAITGASSCVPGGRKRCAVSKVCQLCGKHPTTGFNVSNSMRHTKRRWMPNLQRVRVVSGGGNIHMRVCTACIKAGKVRKAA